ncbi:retinoic acid receptor RXR-alpha-A isoform X7 [Tachysurus ichikawai]
MWPLSQLSDPRQTRQERRKMVMKTSGLKRARSYSGQVTLSPLSSPTSHRPMHPPLLSPTSIGASGSLHSPISTLSSPMNGLGSPFSVISSPMGPHSMASPGMAYGPSVSPQVGLGFSYLFMNRQSISLPF